MSAPAFAVLIEGAGSHPAADTATAGDPASARAVARVVQAAERAGFTAVTFDDHPLPIGRPRLDAVLRAAFVAPLTGAIGLIPVVHAIYSEPFHLATQIGSLDTASQGRAGWIVAGDPDPAIAARHGKPAIPADETDAELVDVVEVVRRLWDSWEDDAVIRDTATGRFFDRDRLHYADFRGARFSVKGPSILPRSPQGQSIVVGQMGTRAEVDLALFDAAPDGDTLAAAALSARALHAPPVRLVLQLEVVLDRAGRTAHDRLAELDAREPWPRTRARYVGDAPGLIDLLTTISAVADGVRILPALPGDLDEIGRAVLPALRTREIFTSPTAGATLRATLGLPRPANRFTDRVTNRVTNSVTNSVTNRLTKEER